MDSVLSTALPFFGLIFMGYAAGKIWRLGSEGLAWLNTFIIYFALPALFFDLLARTPFDQLTNWRFVAATTAATSIAFALALLVGLAASRGHLREATVQALLGAYANVGYMGPGLTLQVFGPAAAVPTALVFCFDNALLFTLTPLLMTLGGGDGQRIGAAARTIAARVLLHPFILATFAGVLAAYFAYVPPAPVGELLRLLRGAAAPCALFALGVTVAITPLALFPRELPVLLAIKLFVHPALVFLLLGLAPGIDPVWAGTAVLMAALPPALNVFVLAQQYGVYVQRASAGILTGTVLSVATVTALIFLLKTGRL